MIVNFYWKEPNKPTPGLGWQFLNRMTIVSHLNVGHEVIIWLDGKEPRSKYWISDLPVKIKRIKNSPFLQRFYRMKNSNPRTASTLFSFLHVYKTGEYFADTDAIALKPWPDIPVLLASSEPEHINVGVFRLPKKHRALSCAIKNIKPEWGNVKVFTDCCRKFKLKSNVPIHQFYPVHWDRSVNTSKRLKCAGLFFDDITLPEDCYSYHYYSNRVSKVGCNHTWVNNVILINSLFSKLSKNIFKNHPMVNDEISGHK